MFHTLIDSIELLLRLDTLLMISLGLVLGIFIGALPGFTTTMAMAVLLPISFFLAPVVGIPFLIGVYKGGIYGGSIPAVLVGIPGTGASVATTYDGLPLTKKGQSRKALDMALAASAIGDFAGSLATIVLIGPIALVAMKFGPPELAAVMVLSMLVIAFSGTTMVVKSLVMLLLGMFFAMIGQDPIGALSRFTFGFFPLRIGHRPLAHADRPVRHPRSAVRDRGEDQALRREIGAAGRRPADAARARRLQAHDCALDRARRHHRHDSRRRARWWRR